MVSGDKVADLPTPALVVDMAALDHNIAAMAEVLPGERLRPHVKAHKCTSLARRQAAVGHRGFTCATIRECEGMAAAGLGADLMLANGVLDASRVGALVDGGARVTLAVDSAETIDAAARGGVREVIIDVNVGLPRCGCLPADAGTMAGPRDAVVTGQCLPERCGRGTRAAPAQPATSRSAPGSRGVCRGAGARRAAASRRTAPVPQGRQARHDRRSRGAFRRRLTLW